MGANLPALGATQPSEESSELSAAADSVVALAAYDGGDEDCLSAKQV